MIVITGATGGLGSEVVKYLLPLLSNPPSQLAVTSSNPSSPSAQAFAKTLPSGVQVRQADFASSPESLAQAFKGASKLLVVSYPSIAHDLRVSRHRNAIDAAKIAGVDHVFYTSLTFCQSGGTEGVERTVTEVGAAHEDTEEYLKNSGLKYTILREGIYSESYPLYLGFWDPSRETNEIVLPSDGPVSWVSRSDLGEATAKLMFQGGHENQTLTLAGPTSHSLKQIASTLATILSRQLTVRIVSTNDYVSHQTSFNANDPVRGEAGFLRAWAKTYQGMAKGEVAKTDAENGGIMEKTLGRKTLGMEEWLKENVGRGGVEADMEKYAKSTAK